jgi:hypothetical protein
MKLWLDDERPKPKGFDFHAKTAKEAITCLESGKVTEISLDHDLGSDDMNATGYFVAQFIELAAHNGWIAPLLWEVHSANPAGRKNIEAAMKSAERFWARAPVLH